MNAGRDRDRFVIMGHLGGPFGVKGWLRVISDAEPRERLLTYTPWHLERGCGWEPVEIEEGRRHSGQLVVKLAGCDDRDAAAALRETRIAVRRDQFDDALAPDEYYWTDLEGLVVRTPDGVELGRVDRLFETGANDVMVVEGERERLVPYIAGDVVLEVDVDEGFILVDWDPDF